MPYVCMKEHLIIPSACLTVNFHMQYIKNSHLALQHTLFLEKDTVL